MMILLDYSVIACIDVVCSASGPLLAVLVFELYTGRQVSLLSLKDLGSVTLGYCMANALIHHAAWTFFVPAKLGTHQQVLWMMLGDLNGALIGAYALKWTMVRLKQGGPTQPS